MNVPIYVTICIYVATHAAAIVYLSNTSLQCIYTCSAAGVVSDGYIFTS